MKIFIVFIGCLFLCLGCTATQCLFDVLGIRVREIFGEFSFWAATVCFAVFGWAVWLLVRGAA